MIVEWVLNAPVLLTAVLVAFAPGTLALLGVGLRGLALLAAAPLFSIASTGLLAVVFGSVGVAWSPLSWGIGSAVLIMVAWGAGRLLGLRLPSGRSSARGWLIPTALAVGVAIGLWRLVAYIWDPSGISQTNDAVFHMNALRFIIETADASSLHVNSVIGGHSFYPAAWHGIVSLVVMLTGASIPVAANIFTLVIGAVIWPIGVTWLTRILSGSDVAAGYAAVLSSALQTFPLLMFQWGVLFPNALSIAVIPAAVAIVVALPGWSVDGTSWRIGFRNTVLILMAMGALVLSQPAALLPWAAICAVWLTLWLSSRASTFGRARVVVALAVIWVALVAVWVYLSRSTSGSHWPPFRGKLEVLLDVLLNGQVMIPFAYVISLLMIIGLIVAVRSHAMRWFAVAWLGVSALYVLVAAIGAPIVREWILGAWYADPYRIAALAPIVVIPLAALGFDAVLRTVLRRTSASDNLISAVGLVVAVVLMTVLVLSKSVAMPAFLTETYDRESRYVAADDAYLTPDERALLESLDELVEPDARVIANPSTGSGFGYFLSGIDVFPRTWAAPTNETWNVIATELRDAAESPAVCDALATYGHPGYVLDFGPGEASPGRYELPGMTDFAGQDGFEFVAAEGDVSLWQITACVQ